MATTDEVISGLCLNQMAYWFGKRPNYRLAEQEYHRISAKWHPMFLFKFENKTVRILDKAGNWDSAPAAPRKAHWVRAEHYRKFFELACNCYDLDQEGILALSVHDGAHDNKDFPFFSFQKKDGERAILLPDIDAVAVNFYVGQHHDTISYSDKLNSAIFVGSTTGGRHTRETVTALSNQRLRSGVFFRDRPEVVFRLPLIRQCESEDVEEMIRALGFGTGKTSWEDQLKHRFLISIDGNGATCSRVSIALKSNSVLLKYNSNSHLYYFPALVAGVNFVPISDDPDVISVINAEKNSPGAFQKVALGGKEFFDEFLTLCPSLFYMAQLIASYFSAFDYDGCDDKIVKANTGKPAMAVAEPSVFSVAHIARRGDRTYYHADWFGDKGSGLPVEGFSINPLTAIKADELEYLVVGGGPSSGDWTRAGIFVGSRGKSNRIYSFAFRLRGSLRDTHNCLYSGAFVGGGVLGPFSDGEECRSPDGSPLEAVQIRIEKKTDL